MNGEMIALEGSGFAGSQVPTGFAPIVPLEGEENESGGICAQRKPALDRRLHPSATPSIALAEAGADVARHDTCHAT
jgi:hypothetical protein